MDNNFQQNFGGNHKAFYQIIFGILLLVGFIFLVVNVSKNPNSNILNNKKEDARGPLSQAEIDDLQKKMDENATTPISKSAQDAILKSTAADKPALSEEEVGNILNSMNNQK